MTDLFAGIRQACAEVARRARHVRIDEAGLARLAAELVERPPGPLKPDPAHQRLADEATTLAYVIVLDAINFGSGWFPHLRKRPGMSGYFSVATALAERFESAGAWSASELQAISAGELAAVLGQDPAVPEVAELMELYARALRDLGALLVRRYDSRFENLVEEAGRRAARLVEILTSMQLYRDVARYEDLEVPFYKRAQLTAADLALAFAGQGPGSFEDLDELTIFADNLVPHVLRCRGVLVYQPELVGRIEAGELLASGSPEEIEIRAVALHAVERCVARLCAADVQLSARELDAALWQCGQSAELKARPRHRTRTAYY